MSGRLFVHIGPPKSGTTSLQYAFDRILHPRFVYAGVLQPRSRNGNSHAMAVYEFTKSTRRLPKDATEAIVKDIRQRVSSGACVVMSEEMLLLSEESMTWRDKLRRLKTLLDDIPTTILVTLRDPQEALPSLYQEIYGILPLRMKLSFAAFCKSERSSCYDFRLVLDELDRLGFEQVRLLDFDILRRGAASSRELFGKDDALDNMVIQVGHKNVGAKCAGTQVRRLDTISLRSLGQLKVVRWLVDHLNIRSKPLFRSAVQLLDRVPIRSSEYRSLDVPDREAERFAEGYRMARDFMEWQDGRPAKSPESQIQQQG